MVVIILLLYFFTAERPVLFYQFRIGRNQQKFQLIKFKTLKTDGSSLQERRFWLGDVLRFLSLDELPQLLNVLRGDMSLVGPRPLPVEYLPLFSSSQLRRFEVKPGITGWAQVNGRTGISWKRKFELDLYYIDHVSLAMDAVVLFRTILLLLSFEVDHSLDEKAFKGNE